MPRWPKTPGTPATPKARSDRSDRDDDRDETPPKMTRRINQIDLKTARGRFKGALLDAIEHTGESDSGRAGRTGRGTKRRAPRPGPDREDPEGRSDPAGRPETDDDDDDEDEEEEDEEPPRRNPRKAAKPGQGGSYVMKLHDRSVDLARFAETTPLYPIIRAWMANRPRRPPPAPAKNGRVKKEEPRPEAGIRLPPPEGPPVPRAPSPVKESPAPEGDGPRIDFSREPTVSKDTLLKNHLVRWGAIKRKWFHQSILYESRYAKTQEMLTEMDTNS